MIRQRTLKASIKATGVGLHSGRRVTVEFFPAPPHTGIVFRRIDLAASPEVKADPFAVTDPILCTTLRSKQGVSISTIEHLSAALACLGIDNLYVHVDAAELPIMDGSAYPFIYVLQQAGIKELHVAKRFIQVKKNVRVTDGDKWLEIGPYHDGFFMDITLQYDHPVIGATPLNFAMNFTAQDFINKVSRARTYCLKRDIENMRAQQLALGGSLENALVVDDFSVINQEGLRYPDEFVKHKWLDVFGDLYLCNHPLLGCVTGYKVGHALNNQLITGLLSDHSAWEWFTAINMQTQSMQAAYQTRMRYAN